MLAIQIMQFIKLLVIEEEYSVLSQKALSVKERISSYVCLSTNISLKSTLQENNLSDVANKIIEKIIRIKYEPPKNPPTVNVKFCLSGN